MSNNKEESKRAVQLLALIIFFVLISATDADRLLSDCQKPNLDSQIYLVPLDEFCANAQDIYFSPRIPDDVFRATLSGSQYAATTIQFSASPQNDFNRIS